MPSGRLKVNVTLSPSFGLMAPRSTVTAGGEPVGCVDGRAGQRRGDRGELQAERRTVLGELVTVVVSGGDETARCPKPPAPRSAWLRSAISCFSPACVPLPLRMSSADTVAGVSMARPENR